MSARGFLGAGDLYIARYNSSTGTFDDFDGPFLASKMEVKPNSDLKEMSSKGRDDYGQIIESVPLPKPADFNVTLSEVNKEALSMALFGSQTTYSQGSGTITNEAKVLKHGKWVELSKQNFATAGFVVTNTAGTTTYVLDTDYEVNYRTGMIRSLASGAISDGSTVHVDGSYNAISGTQIAGATQSQIRAKFKLDGKNFADDLPVIVDVYEAVLTPDNAFDFLANDFAEIQLKGRMKTPAGKSEPFKVVLRDA